MKWSRKKDIGYFDEAYATYPETAYAVAVRGIWYLLFWKHGEWHCTRVEYPTAEAAMAAAEAILTLEAA